MRLAACGVHSALLLMLTLWWLPEVWAQQIHRWVDERGRVHYSDTPPARAVEQSVLDKQGRVLRPPARASMVPDKTADGGARARDIARERQDQALLSTYVHEAEIDLARDRALAQEKARQVSLQSMLEQARMRLAQIDAESKGHVKAGRSIPEALRQSRSETEREIARLNDMLGRSAAAMAQTEARYDAYKRRYRELKGLTGQPPTNSGAPTTAGNAIP